MRKATLMSVSGVRNGEQVAQALPDETGVVYPPQEDTALLVDALADVALAGARVVDLCTGSGAVAVVAGLQGGRVTAVDSSSHAVEAARSLAEYLDLDVDVRHGTVADFTGAERFDVLTCNPPYMPTSPEDEKHAPGVLGPSHAWDAGADGRAVLDVLCARLPSLLSPTGTALIVQSEVADIERTVSDLRAQGFDARVIRRRLIPFGPVLRSRRAWLVATGRLRADSREELIAVIRADRGRSSGARR